MTELVTLLLIFIGTAFGFLAVNLMLGRIVRPNRPSAEKDTIYECGEPAIGSSWIQFDLRFYVVALLFVIFDVELAFFFPWATVFGNANKLARDDLSPQERIATSEAMAPPYMVKKAESSEKQTTPEGAESVSSVATVDREVADQREASRMLAWIAFADILFFFGVLLVGFAYLWKRGDLDWVRSTVAQTDGPPSTAEREK
jgi:NADH-quinone oxidoreductase subunit A